MEEVLPSSMDIDVNQLDVETLISELLSSPPEEVPVNQSSISCNDQAGQNIIMGNDVDSIQQTTQFPTPLPDQTMTTMGGLDGTSSSCINQIGPNWPQTPSSDQQWTNQLPMSSHVSGMLPQPPMNQWHQNSFIHQPQPGHVYMTQNATTSQHGGFNQPTPRSQMDSLQVRGLQNRTARPNASNSGPDSSLQSQNRGLNTQQVSFRNYVEYMAGGSMKCSFCPHKYAKKTSISRIKWHLSGEENHGVAICRGVTKEVQEEALKAMRGGNKRHKCTTSSINVPGKAGRRQVGIQGTEQGVREERIQSHSQVENDMEDTGEGSFGQDADQASVTPHIDNMQQQSLGRSTRSQMENLQVRGLQNRAARPNASNPSPDSSLQSQNRGLDTQQVSFRNYVEYMASGRMKCSFCPHTYAKNTSISRIKWHLSGEEGHEVAICRGVTKEVQEEALKAMRGGNKRHKSTTSSINVNDRGISSCPQEQDIENENMGGDIGMVLREVQVVEAIVGDERISSHAVEGNDVVSMTGMGAQEDRVSEGALESRLRIQRALEQSNLAGTAGRTQGAGEERIQSNSGARSSESLKDNKTRGVPFPTSSNMPVGQAFEENRKVIWSLLMDDELSTIGIYGMGGVGKTTILQHIHNELLDKPDVCDHVWWVTVSQDCSINRLQNLIAKRLYLDLSSEDDDLHRAAKLSEELRQKKKWILILDDLWNNFELHEVGIPIPLKGCKLILTTRSRKVCDQIDCQHKIEVKPLLEEDSWTLFKENLGRHIALSDEVEGIAKAVARECAGLPLGIITIASSFRGVDDLHEWRTTLKNLKDSEIRDMKVFKLLRFSYDQLGDLALQQCLLYCALFREDHWIKREELIGYLIDEGIIKGMGRRQDAFDEGHKMLNRLQYVCLLESAIAKDGGKYVKMHDLIRDMAIQILQEKSQVIVKAGAQLVELPDAEEWTENLTRVSLMQNRFKEIPPSHSPMCPNLSTLLLCQNEGLRFIADSFFKQLHGLKLLDLSHTDIEKLPDSVSDLVSLTALLLIDCWQLRYVPSLEKLRALKSLDLYGTSLEKMPQGMECLSSLRYLRINGCDDEEFPSGILPKLSHLQVLALGEVPTECLTVEGMEVGCLGKLETLECRFEGFSDFVEYFRSRDGIQSLSTYRILVGTLNEDSSFKRNDFPSKTVLLGNLSINRDRDFQVKFVNDIQVLHCECIDARSLCDVLSLENATELEIIVIEYCDSMESLVSSSWFSSALPQLPSHNGMFSRLKEFHCYGCDSMEKLFPLELLSYLVNLEVITVSCCWEMEEIIGTTDEESSTSNPIAELALPKLRKLHLYGLPELKGICSGKLICNSLEVITVEDCEKLKRMAICLPLLENGQPSPHPSLEWITASPREWWETVVEWEPPNAKEVLRPIVHSLW